MISSVSMDSGNINSIIFCENNNLCVTGTIKPPPSLPIKCRIAKYTSDLVLISSYVENNTYWSDESIVQDSYIGNIWLVGGDYVDYVAGYQDAYIVKYNSLLSPRFIIAFDGNLHLIDGWNKSVFDSSGNLWVIGWINERNWNDNAEMDLWLGKIEGILGAETPSYFSSAAEISSITWNWGIGYDATSYYLINESSQIVSPVLSSSTFSWTETDLSPNTAYSRAIVSANQFGISTSTFLTKYTLAQKPDNFSVSGVFITSVTLSWSANGNPSYTRYEIIQSTDNFITDISTPMPLSAGLISLTTTLYNLEGATTYYFKLRAYNNEDIPTEFTNIISTLTLPYPIPDLPIISEIYSKAISTNAINWSWIYNGTNPVEGFNLISSTGGYIIKELSSSTSFYIQTNLLPNTSSTIQVQAYYLIKNSTSAFKTIYTLSNPPIGSKIDKVYQTSATINWNENGNSPLTLYEIYISTDDINFKLYSSTITNTLEITDLNENTTYYWKIRSVNNDGIASNYDLTISTYIPYIPPKPPANFIAISSEPNKVVLSWQPSPTPEVTQYNIYTDSGSGIINYNLPISTLPAEVLSLSMSGISPGIYYYAIRAQKYSCEEKNTDIKTSVEVMPGEPFPLWVQARITSPKSGQKIWGNRINVFSELIRGKPSYTKEIRFQYRVSTTSSWIDIPAVYYNNPNNKEPYYIQWDVTGLIKQEYQIRALAVNINNQSDPYAPGIFINVSDNDPDIISNISGNSIVYSEKIYGNTNNAIEFGAIDQNHYLKITIPKNSIISDTRINIINPPNIIPEIPRNLLGTGLFYEINLENGQSNLNSKVILKSNYIDENNDGLVDGTLARIDRLSFMYYNQQTGKWQKEYPTEIDLNERTITMETNHLSIYGIFSPAAENLNNVRVYPNPYKPNDGNDDTGKPYNPNDPNSGVIFDNLPQMISIKIYTITGQLVWEKTTNDTSGKLQWDTKNVSSGIYLAVITDLTTKQKVIKKIGIIK